jgi:hypothetical protein
LSLRRLSLLVLLLVAIVATPAVAGVDEEEQFPLPVVAPVLLPDGVSPELAVESYGLTQDGDAVQVNFTTAFEPPEVFSYEIDLLVGDPDEDGDQLRMSYVSDEGVVSGVVAESDGDGGFTEVGEIDVSYEEGVATIGLSDELDPGDNDVAWVEVTLIADEEGDVETFTTPLVPAGDLLSPSGPATTTAQEAWGSSDQPPEPSVSVGDGPVLSLDDDTLVVEYTAPNPTEVGGFAVAGVTDVVRIAPSYLDVGAVPDLLVIDHAADTVSLLDGTTPIPAEIDSQPDLWLEDGLPTRGVQEGDAVRVSLPDVLEAFDVDVDGEIDESDVLGLGIARSVRVDDGSENGLVYRADGMMATGAWFGGNAEEAPVVAEPPADDDDEPWFATPIVIGAALLIAGTIAFLLLRWWEHRRRMQAATSIGAAPPATAKATPEEKERLEEFTKALFDEKSKGR